MATVERDSGTRPSKPTHSYPPDLEDSFGTGRDAGQLAYSNAAMSTRVGCQGCHPGILECEATHAEASALRRAACPRQLARSTPPLADSRRTPRGLRATYAACESSNFAAWRSHSVAHASLKNTGSCHATTRSARSQLCSPPGLSNVPASAACSRDRCDGGGRGIRTPETLASLAVFKTAAFNHSAIPPRTFSLAVNRLESHPLATAIFLPQRRRALVYPA